MRNKYKIYPFLIVLVAVLLIQFFNLISPLENNISDRLYQDGEKVSPYIYVIGIDEETLNEYGSFDIWSREKLAELINLLNEDENNKSAVIGIDVGLYGYKDEDVENHLKNLRLGNKTLLSHKLKVDFRLSLLFLISLFLLFIQ